MAAATLVQSLVQTHVKMTGNGDNVGDKNTSGHPWSVHFVVMTHRKYLTVLLQKQTNKTLLMESQSTEPGLWNQPKLEQDPCCVTRVQ